MVRDTDGTTERTGALVGLVVIVFGAMLVFCVRTTGTGMMGGGMWGSGMQSGGVGWGWLVGLLVWVGLLTAVVALGYVLVRSHTGADGTDPAIAELRAAYARGDLSDEEYEHRLDRLEASRGRD